MSGSTSSGDTAMNARSDDDLLFEDPVETGAILADLWPAAPSGFGGVSAPEGSSTDDSLRSSPMLEFINHRLSGQAITLGWPVFAWRVAATIRQRKAFDFLQMASLRLAQAGIWTASEQAGLLTLHRELLERVMKELLDRDLIDANGRPTEAGRHVIANGAEEDDQTTWGWLFQDALTGELLPFLHTRPLPYTRRDPPGPMPGLELSRLIDRPRRPRPLDLVRAYERWLELDALAREEATVGGEGAPGTNALFVPGTDATPGTAPGEQTMAEREQTQRAHIRLLEDHPLHVQLRIWIDLQGADDSSFRLHSPFGLPDALCWTRLLHFAASQAEEIDGIVRQLQATSLKTWQARQPKPLEPDRLAREAYDELAVTFGGQPGPRWRLLWEELERFTRSRLLVRRGFDETDTLITRAQRVLEQLLITWLDHDLPRLAILLPYRRPEDLERRLRDSALACGIAEAAIPQAIVRTRPGSVRRVLEKRGLSLTTYAATLLMAASRSQGFHAKTLREVIIALPDFLSRIDTVAEARNRFGAHTGRTSHRPDQLIEEVVEHTERCVRDVLRVLSR